MHAAGLSLAAKVNKNAVTRLEAGTSLPTLPTIEKLARALALSPAWLAYGLGNRAPAAATSDPAGLADRAKKARAILGISLRELAQRAGVTDGAVRSAESGRQSAIGTLELLAHGLAVSPAWLAFGLGDRELPARLKTVAKPTLDPLRNL